MVGLEMPDEPRALRPFSAHRLPLAPASASTGFRRGAFGSGAGRSFGVTFGTDAEREHALHGIRTIHTRVNGHLREAVGVFPAGAAYSAEDPALVLWVHLTLLESIPLAYERFVGTVSTEERDNYCAESAWVATAPTPASAHVTSAPTENQCDCTATPISPVTESRATME